MYVMFMNHIKVDGSVCALPQALFAFPLCSTVACKRHKLGIYDIVFF